jgi:hypothetical protein
LYQAALAGYRQALGDTHPDTLSSMGNLANLYSTTVSLANSNNIYAILAYQYAIEDSAVLYTSIKLIQNTTYYLTKNLKRDRQYLTDDEVVDIALKYDSYTDFYNKLKSTVWQAAFKRGLLDIIKEKFKEKEKNNNL